MGEFVKVFEVGLRDGLQNENSFVTTAQKVRLLDGLIEAGLKTIEVASFVHPGLVPQMADAEAVVKSSLAREKEHHLNLVSLALNQKGFDRALAAGSKNIAFAFMASESLNRRNNRASIEESIAAYKNIYRQAKEAGMWVRVYIGTAWVCPFEGVIAPEKTIRLAEQIWEVGVDEIAISDTVGHAHPWEVGELMAELGRRLDMSKLAVHLHDTQALGLANAAAALYAGVRTIDAGIGGLGGCPYAPGAAGNLATEDLVFMLHKMGFETGIDFIGLWPVVELLGTMVQRPVGGRIRNWWAAECRVPAH